MIFIFSKSIQVTTHGEGDCVDISHPVCEAVKESGIGSGLVNIFVTGSTSAITTIEYEPGVLEDLKRALRLLAPDDAHYQHDTRWGDGNGRSHVKAALVGPTLTIPFRDSELLTGTWQQVVLLELDVRSKRTRTVMITVW